MALAKSTAEAIEHVEAILTRYGHIDMQRQDTECELVLWNVESVRVAEVDWHTLDHKAGSSFMQSDLPIGLAVCAAVERWIVALINGDDELIRDERLNVASLLVKEPA